MTHFSDEVLFTSPSGDLIVKLSAKGVYNVFHAPTMLIVPTRSLPGENQVDIGTYRETWKYKGEVRATLSSGWRTQAQAKKYALAIDASGILHDYPDTAEARKDVLFDLIEFMRGYGS